MIAQVGYLWTGAISKWIFQWMFVMLRMRICLDGFTHNAEHSSSNVFFDFCQLPEGILSVKKEDYTEAYKPVMIGDTAYSMVELPGAWNSRPLHTSGQIGKAADELHNSFDEAANTVQRLLEETLKMKADNEHIAGQREMDRQVGEMRKEHATQEHTKAQREKEEAELLTISILKKKVV